MDGGRRRACQRVSSSRARVRFRFIVDGNDAFGCSGWAGKHLDLVTRLMEAHVSSAAMP